MRNTNSKSTAAQTSAKPEPLTEKDLDHLLKLLWLKARVMEKRRSPRTKLMGDLMLIGEILSRGMGQ